MPGTACTDPDAWLSAADAPALIDSDVDADEAAEELSEVALEDDVEEGAATEVVGVGVGVSVGVGAGSALELTGGGPLPNSQLP